MTSNSPHLPQEIDLFELIIFSWRKRWSIFWGLCFGVVLAMILTTLKQRKSAGVVYQIKLSESLDELYGTAPTGNFIVDLLQQDKWNDFFYRHMKQNTPEDETNVRNLLDTLIQQNLPFGLHRHELGGQGAIFTARWPDEHVATVLNPLIPQTLNLMVSAYNEENHVLKVKIQTEFNALQNEQATVAAEILRLASKYYPPSLGLLNTPLSQPREEGQLLSFQSLILIAGFIPDSDSSKKDLIDKFLLNQKNVNLLTDRRKVAFGNQSNFYQSRLISFHKEMSLSLVENENTAIRVQLWLSAFICIAFGGLLGLGVSGGRAYYRLNRHRLWTAMNSKEAEIVRGNG